MKKIISIGIALNFLGIGINFVLQAGFGCDAITMINDGLARFLHTSYTLSGLLYNTVFIVLALLFAKDLLGWGSVSYAYGTGIFIDVYQNVLEPFHIADAPLLMNVLMLVIGQLLICFAFAMLIEMNLGRSALDALLARIEKDCALSYQTLKTICDVILVIIASMLGAAFGIGTIVCVLSGGITIQAFCRAIACRKGRRECIQPTQ